MQKIYSNQLLSWLWKLCVWQVHWTPTDLGRICRPSHSDIQRDAASLVPPTKKVTYCQKHPVNILKIYCETCGEHICNDCIIRLHQGHNYDLVTDIFPRYNEEIASSLQPMKLWLAIVDKAIQTLDTRANEIDDQRTTVEAKSTKKSTACSKPLSSGEQNSLVIYIN